mmetsp:Transcript_50078/g.55934  ORF Transcript_50078/g.55934 Transcript_50078/m.55934 type:complete len:97 (+) Transcript_50078:99-389(+)
MLLLHYTFFLSSIDLGIKDVTRYARGYILCNCSQQTTNRSTMGYSSLPVRERLVTRQKDSTKTIFVLTIHPTTRKKKAQTAIGKHVPGPLTSIKSG